MHRPQLNLRSFLVGRVAALSACVWFAFQAVAAPPLALHPQNPHYFLFRGKPTVLITSGEHYGAVLNLDFNYSTYLQTLAKEDLNLTRTFSGAYVEPSGAFNIERNTLAPASGRFLCPWARTERSGYAGGGAQFDLTRWDSAYFARLRDFLAVAARHGVVVEMNLFCPFYEESQWRLSPMHAGNNVNGLGDVSRTNVYTTDRHGGLLAVQEAMVRQIVTELNDRDNLYYEICNEPYFGGVTLAWQHRMADVIVGTEQSLNRRHLISQNIANGCAKVDQPHPSVSIFNFHYATPPDAVAMNEGLGRVIGDNETGFAGTNNLPYRREAWHFMLAGGGLFNHLDYSFAAGHEDGTYVYPAKQPGGGNALLRRQLRTLSRFIHRFSIVRMRPGNEVLRGGIPDGCSARVWVDPGRAYALYLSRNAEPAAGEAQSALQLALPRGSYDVEWLDPITGASDPRPRLHHSGGSVQLATPPFREDLAARIVRR